MMSAKITSDHLTRKAIVYVRQSTAAQVRENLESQRRQYALVDHARTLGFGDAWSWSIGTWATRARLWPVE